MMELMHYSHAPVTLDRGRVYEQREPYSFGKPVGLWVSVRGRDDWAEWVTENMDSARLAVAHRVTLSDSARIHVITNAVALDAFTGTCAVQTDFERRYGRADCTKWPIDWREVAKDCDGIIIAPYQWKCRYDYDWYYGWGCASGCIWNVDAIADFALLPAEVTA